MVAQKTVVILVIIAIILSIISAAIFIISPSNAGTAKTGTGNSVNSGSAQVSLEIGKPAGITNTGAGK